MASFFPFLFSTSLVILFAWSHVAESVTIPACDSFANNDLTISVHSSGLSGISYENQTLNKIVFSLTRNTELKCQYGEATKRKIHFQSNHKLWPKVQPRNFKVNTSDGIEAHRQSYFTLSGHFYDNVSSAYYRPDGDYCVESNSDDEITLQVCAVSNDCKNSALPNVWCVPKCCALDEVMLYWKRQCVKRSETNGTTPWLPPIFQGTKNPHKKVSQSVVSKNVLFQMKSLPENCAFSYVDENEELHRSFMHATGSDVEPPNNSMEAKLKDHIKLTYPSGVKSGVITAMALNHFSRRWVHHDQAHFCVDGFHFQPKNSSKQYVGNEHEFIIIYCVDQNANVEEEEFAQVESNRVSWSYIAVSIIALVFLVLIIVVYGILWKEQNLHGLTILSYTVATLGSYLFLMIAHIISLYPDLDPMYMTPTERNLCYINAVLAHYFFLASYLWLTVMNFDLWLTFKQLRVVKRDSKEWVKLGWYSLVAWVFPLVLVLAFVGVNETYWDPTTEVAVPDYAKESCFVSTYFRGEYVYIPMGILLAINTLLIIVTMLIFVKARKKTGKTFKNGATNINGAKLFIKLFIVMGGVSLVDIITWCYNNNDTKHWSLVVLENISYLVPIAYFVIFCLTGRVLGQLRNKYPNFMKHLDPLFKLSLFKEKEHTASTTEFSMETNRTNGSAGTNERRRENVPLNTISA